MIQKAFLRSLAIAALILSGCTTTPTLHRTVTINVHRDGVVHAALHEVTTKPDTHIEFHLASTLTPYESGKEVTMAVTTYTENSGYKSAEDYLTNSPHAYGLLLRGTVTNTSPNKAHVVVANVISKTKGNALSKLNWEGDVEIGVQTVIFDETQILR